MMPYKYRKNKTVLLAALLLSFVFISPLRSQNNQASKNPKKELDKKRRKINEEINQITSMLNETKASKKTSIGTLVKLNVKLEKRQSLINTINSQLVELDGEIRQNENESAQLKSNLEKLKKEYARMIVFAQRNKDSYSTLMFIFAAADFNQAYSRLKYMQQYSEFRKKQAAEIINNQTLLIAKLNELKDQHREKNMLLGNEEVEKKNLSAEKSEQEVVLTALQQKEKELKTELEKKKQDAIQLQVAIRRMIEAEIKRKAEEAAKIAEARAIAAKKAKEEKEEKQKKNNAAKGHVKEAPDKKEPPVVAAAKPEKKEDAFVPALTEEAEALSADFANNRGKLPWPVVKGVICETYGEHEHPAIKGFMMFNNGLEICATKGMQARAVFEGEVTGIAVSPTGGKLVIIRHGEYLSVYSNLADVVVKTGQKVSVKQVIGSVMYDEDEGKTSMNLQIWKGQKTMDPGGWLFNAR